MTVQLFTSMPLAVGTWAWGERKYWGYETDFGARDVVDAFAASVEAGVDLFDTAEVYGDGESEKILGWMMRKSGRALRVATKFGLLPGRRGARALRLALERSLKRLGLPRVDLYQIHWPDRTMATIDELMDALADVADAGLVSAVGVSNFSADETRQAHARLATRGIALASNQVRYSLLHRAPEVNGTLDVCRELGVTLLAYSPLEQGLLTGTYGPGRLPAGPRAGHPEFAPGNLERATTVVELCRAIGTKHGGRTPAQVALRWLMQQEHVVPIAGAKTGAQATENAGALGWALDAGALDALDAASRAWRIAES